MINEKVKIKKENVLVVENELLSIQAHYTNHSAPIGSREWYNFIFYISKLILFDMC